MNGIKPRDAPFPEVGFFLEQHQDQFEVRDEQLEKLIEHRPRLPQKVLVGSKEGKLVSKWNLIIPPNAINREWEKFSWQ